MDTVPKPPTRAQRGKRIWTDAQRAEQARKLRVRQIWLKSTDPTTSQGKRISSRNSYKHGRFTYEKKILRWYLHLAVMRVKQIRTHLAFENHKRENELRDKLRDKYGISQPSRAHTMAFYPYFKVHPLYAKKKQLRTPGQKSENQKIFDFFTSLAEE